MMNCTECRELLVAYFEGLLEESQERAVEEHLKGCEACRAELKELQTLRQSLVRSARATAEADLEERVMNRIIQEQSERLQSAQRATAGLRIRRLIMKSSIAKIAVAAAMIAVAVGAWSLWSGTQPSVALADVLARVQQVQAFAYKMTMHV
ncbi:MAG: anti-sigma factor family protein, partial [Solirubrobacterales bacterium]